MAYEQDAMNQMIQMQQQTPSAPLPMQYSQQQRTVPITDSNPEFLQWLFGFRDEVVTPLKHIWKGEELDNNGQWQPNKNDDSLIIMNNRGITWCISLIESYINPVYIVSNYDETAMNWTMRELGIVVWNSLCLRYEDFGIKKSDIPRVSGEIISKVHAILLGARGNGYREFFTKTHHTEELRTQQMEQHKGLFGGFGLFKKPQQQQPPSIYDNY